MSGGDLSTLDLVCQVMDSPLRPLDYTLLLHLKHPLDGEQLRRGALSARSLYPSTGSSIEGKKWHRPEAPGHGLTIKQTDNASRIDAIQEFLRVPFRLDREPPIRQLLIQDKSSPAFLVTRVHHVAGDLISALMWIRHQLRVASGRDQFVEHIAPYERIELRQCRAQTSKSPSAYKGRCDPIWTPRTTPSAERCWTTLRIEASQFLGLSRTIEGFTYNDVLLTCALDTFDWWNGQHGAADWKVGLWVPMNIREEAFKGFGNGTSRIRVYRRFADDASLPSKCRQIRSQIDWSRRNGEWAVPERHILVRLPFHASAYLLKGFLNRPWADMGSASLTHVERWPGQMDEEFADVRSVEVIGALHRRHALMMAAVTHSGVTWTTLTYDPALLDEDEVATIGQRFEHSLATAARQL